MGVEATVEELLKAGANVNAMSSEGVTSLHDAVAAGHYQVIEKLSSVTLSIHPKRTKTGGITFTDFCDFFCDLKYC